MISRKGFLALIFCYFFLQVENTDNEIRLWKKVKKGKRICKGSHCPLTAITPLDQPLKLTKASTNHKQLKLN
jgi:hypothetical protein